MADICTAVENICAGGGHGTVTVAGVTERIAFGDEAPTAEEVAIARRVGLWKLHQKGVTLAALVNRVVIGEEATNVKSYPLIAPGVEVARTNVGATPVNILPGTDGQEMLVDFTGCVEFRAKMTMLLVSGTWGFQLVRQNGTVLYESPNQTGAGEKVLDTGWMALPAGFDSEALIRITCGSNPTASAVFRRASIGVR